jgi:pimeloyl-ACP methyl ester carboxylesterase
VFPSARLVVIPDSGHWPFIDNPEEVVAHVIPFLREQTGAPKEA